MSNAFYDYLKKALSVTRAGTNDIDKQATKETNAQNQTKRDDLEQFLSGSASADKPKLPDAPVYERLEYNNISDADIEKRVKDELDAYYNQNVNAINQEIESLFKKYEADKINAQKTAADTESAVASAYESAQKDVSNDSLKRGLARSSIAVNKQAQIAESAAGENSRIAKELADRIQALDSEISSLDVKREKALNDFNIAYASKLTANINSLKDEREKSRIEALKYNNMISEKEHSDTVDKIMKESSLYTDALNQQQKENNNSSNVNYQANYEKMREYLSGLNKTQARDAIAADPLFKNNLNDYYYYRLYDEFAR